MQPDVQQLGQAGDDLWRQMPQGHQRHALLAQGRLIGIRKSGGNAASAFLIFLLLQSFVNGLVIVIMENIRVKSVYKIKFI